MNNTCISFNDNNTKCTFKTKNINNVNLYCLRHYKKKYNHIFGGDQFDRDHYSNFTINDYKQLLPNDFFNKYEIIKHITRTFYCDIFIILEISTKIEFIMKSGFVRSSNKKFSKEDKKLSDDILFKIETEYNLIKQFNHDNIIKLKNNDNFYKNITNNSSVICFISVKYFETLNERFRRLNQDIPINKIKKIGIDLINTTRYLHQNNIIYVDYSINNIMFKDSTLWDIVLIDLGMCENFMVNDQFRPFIKGNQMYGTLSFSSKNATIGNTSDRIDDIESITYIILFLVAKYLPWDSKIIDYSEQVVKKIYNSKLVLYKSKLLKKLPDFMKQLIWHLDNYKYFNEVPEYDNIINILNN
jgi:serine/threonine protein kinase